jgi:hypothetical protein
MSVLVEGMMDEVVDYSSRILPSLTRYTDKGMLRLANWNIPRPGLE